MKRMRKRYKKYFLRTENEGKDKAMPHVQRDGIARMDDPRKARILYNQDSQYY